MGKFRKSTLIVLAIALSGLAIAALVGRSSLRTHVKTVDLRGAPTRSIARTTILDATTRIILPGGQAIVVEASQLSVRHENGLVSLTVYGYARSAPETAAELRSIFEQSGGQASGVFRGRAQHIESAINQLSKQTTLSGLGPNFIVGGNREPGQMLEFGASQVSDGGWSMFLRGEWEQGPQRSD